MHNNQNSADIETNEFNLFLTVIKIVIAAIFVLPLVEYSFKLKNDDNSTDIQPIKSEIKLESITEEKQIEKAFTSAENKRKPLITKEYEEICPKNDVLVILKSLILELIEKNEFCTPENFNDINKHKIPKSIIRNYKNASTTSKQEAKVPAIVNCAVGVILMVSLAAALLELYKAKRHPTKKDSKNSLSRKCSLADLTVMKHHRKEMVRRESLLEPLEENVYSKQLNRKVSRTNLRFD